MADAQKKKNEKKKKKEHKPDETLRDGNAENPHPRMFLASTTPLPPIVWTFATPRSVAR